MATHAIALVSFNDAGTETAHPRDSFIESLDDGQFLNWSTASLVRAATDEEIAAHFAPAPSTTATTTRRKPSRAGSKE